jgi:predicted RNA-binding Zn-ribbon protein involved in translation (DUF1610 family)
MSRGLRLTEKWLQRALWLVALAFAAFLNGLGGVIVGNLGGIETPLTVEQFIDPTALKAVEAQRDQAVARRDAAKARLDQAEAKHAVARANTLSAREAFDNWVATRQATAQPDQDAELIKRTAALDALAAQERRALGAVEVQRQAMLDASQQSDSAFARMNALERPAHIAYAAAMQRLELRVFAYRLALTLPLLLIAGWLFAKKRKGTYWPFAWGFIIFAVSAFFVEMVPYLPSYGGYVRYVVGIIVTIIAGRYAIVTLHRYLARQKENEAMPNSMRRQALGYDLAQARLAKSVCPSCERRIDLKDASLDFCPHCGIGLADRCTSCATRKNAFARYCFSCGTPANTSLAS